MSYQQKSNQPDSSVWDRKDRAEDWRSIWHSLVTRKDVSPEEVDKYIKATDKVYAHLEAVRECDLPELITEAKKEIKPF
jgi:predicted transcriptional regulator